MTLTHTMPQPYRVGDFDPATQHAAAISRQGAELQVGVFIVSDVRLHRDGLASLLRGCPSVRVLGGDSLRDSPIALRGTVTDVALLDVVQPADSYIVDALRQVRPRLRILALGIRDTASEMLSCVAAHLDGYVRIDAAIEDMLAAIKGMFGGELLCSAEIASSWRRSAPGSRSGPAPLTIRELQVADLINRGLSNKEIARQLAVKPCTAKNHVRNILQKLDVHRRGQAVAKLRGV